MPSAKIAGERPLQWTPRLSGSGCVVGEGLSRRQSGPHSTGGSSVVPMGRERLHEIVVELARRPGRETVADAGVDERGCGSRGSREHLMKDGPVNTDEVSSLILRFRDLATGRGETVALHNDIAARAGFVWWAWWRKGGEKVPEAVFRRLRTRAQEAGGLDVFMFDSGRNLVLRARLMDIVWNEMLDEIPSPDPSLTPEYYRDRRYQAWFKLGLIEDTNEEVLHERTYVRVDEFFEAGYSRYQSFYGKQVSSSDELQQQNRTIWFTRGYRVGDGTREISLLEAASIEPSHFPKRSLSSDSTRLLWISDLHFSENRGEHGYPLESHVGEYPLAQRLEDALGANKSLGGLIVTGDLTWSARREQFALAKQSLRQLQSLTGMPETHLAVLPGNHDLAFSADPAGKGSRVTATAADARSEYEQFYESLFFQRPSSDEHLISGRRYLLGHAVPVELVCLNSSALQQTKGHFQGHGYLGPEQLSAAAHEFGWDRAGERPRAWRVVALHHHVIPITYRELPVTDQPYSVVLDAEALMRWVAANHVDVVIHGHMHQPAFARVVHPLNALKPNEGSWLFSVFAMGSTGVARTHVGEVGHNTFGVLDFSPDRLTVLVRSIHPTNPAQDLWQVEVPRGSGVA